MKTSGWWLLAAALGLPGLAFGAEQPGEQGQQFKVQAQAGVMTYAGEAAQVTKPGFTYGVAVSGDIGELPAGLDVGGELGYLGSVYNTDNAAIDNSTVVENGGQALAKVGPEIGHFEPYALGGINVSRLSVSDDQAVGQVQDSTLVRIPMGVGIDYSLKAEGRGLTVGARGMYSFSTNNNSFPTTTGSNSEATWTGMAAVGGSF